VLFTRAFTPDTTLKERLRAEAGGILAWMIEGCLEWQRVGLAVPEEVRKATEAYLDSQDDLGQFIADECVVDSAAVTKIRLIYECWRQWCQRNGVFASSFSDFQEMLRGRFKVTNTHNVPEVHGLRLFEAFGRDQGPAVRF
jgi:putative DNA primase/helicase